MPPYLSDEQQHIVDMWTTNGGAMLVAASAGSGKTRILTQCIRQLLESSPKDKYHILGVTFTVKAADELKERLRGVKGLKERAFIGNIHSFALDVLRAYRHELGYIEMPHIVENETDRKEILKEVFLTNPILESVFSAIPDVEKEAQLEKYQSALLMKTLTWISEQKRNLVLIDNDTYEYENWEQKHLQVYKEYNNHLRNQGLIDYDDILLLACSVLSNNAISSIYQRFYKYILIDEAQDLNYAQYQLIKTLCGESIRNILMVGDEKQTIHGYVGANKKYMFDYFTRDFGASRQDLLKNYRSSKAVLRLANYLSHNKNIIDVDDKHRVDGVAKITEFDSDDLEAQAVLSTVKGVIESDKTLTLDNIAVLARNRFVFKKLESLLNNDSVLKDRFFVKKMKGLEPESYFMKVFDLGTIVAINTQADTYKKKLSILLKIDVRGVDRQIKGMDFLKALSAYITDDNVTCNKEMFSTLLYAWEIINNNANSLSSAIKKIEEILPLINNPDERYLIQQDILEWREMWSAYIRTTNNPSLSDFRRYVIKGYAKNTTTQGLMLASVHAVKGLEFDVVFLMGMADGIFPDYRALNNELRLQEELNNAYVAVTRAKTSIYISFSKNKETSWGIKPQKISQFLEGFNPFF